MVTPAEASRVASAIDGMEGEGVRRLAPAASTSRRRRFPCATHPQCHGRHGGAGLVAHRDRHLHRGAVRVAHRVGDLRRRCRTSDDAVAGTVKRGAKTIDGDRLRDGRRADAARAPSREGSYLPLAAHAPPATLPSQVTDCGPAGELAGIDGAQHVLAHERASTVTSARRVSLNATATVSRAPSPFGEQICGVTTGKPSVRSTTTARLGPWRRCRPGRAWRSPERRAALRRRHELGALADAPVPGDGLRRRADGAPAGEPAQDLVAGADHRDARGPALAGHEAHLGAVARDRHRSG